MEELPWADSQPTNYPDFDCAFFYNSSQRFSDGLYALQSCPICEVNSTLQKFVPRGVCLHSSAVDGIFMMESFYYHYDNRRKVLTFQVDPSEETNFVHFLLRFKSNKNSNDQVMSSYTTDLSGIVVCTSCKMLSIVS